ncbi:MAG: SRPBCC family protein [Cyanobacteria bacterium P01_D01_bin.36]
MPISFTSEFEINAPPTQVMAEMTDFDSWHHWMDGLIKIEKLTDGPYSVGTQWRETRKMFGKEASEVFEVTGFEPPHSVNLRVDGSQGTTGKGEYRFFYTLVPNDGDRTQLTMHSEIEMPGIVPKLFGFLLKGMFKQGCDRDTLALKAYLEEA